MHTLIAKSVVIAVLSVGLSLACSKDDAASGDETAKGAPSSKAAAADPNQRYQCMKESKGICTEYSGDALVLGEASLKSGCDAMEGVFAEGECTRSNTLGTCDVGAGQLRVYYPSEGAMGNTAESVPDDCEIYDGTFSAP